jgi:hypothetical protein
VIIFILLTQEKDIMQSQCGPHGLQLNPTLMSMATQNAAFSQWAWEVAKQDGCLPCASAPYPSWPPKSPSAFTYPTLQSLEEVSGLDTAAYGAPYVPSQLEQLGSQPSSLACAVPASVRATFSAFQPEQGVASSNGGPFTIPLSLDDAINNPGSSDPLAGTPAAHKASEDDDDDDTVPPTALPSLMMNTLQGIGYDLQHWSELPAQGPVDKASFVLGRDSRPFYMLLWFLLFVAIYMALKLVL